MSNMNDNETLTLTIAQHFINYCIILSGLMTDVRSCEYVYRPCKHAVRKRSRASQRADTLDDSRGFDAM